MHPVRDLLVQFAIDQKTRQLLSSCQSPAFNVGAIC